MKHLRTEASKVEGILLTLPIPKSGVMSPVPRELHPCRADEWQRTEKEEHKKSKSSLKSETDTVGCFNHSAVSLCVWMSTQSHGSFSDFIRTVVVTDNAAYNYCSVTLHSRSTATATSLVAVTRLFKLLVGRLVLECVPSVLIN